MNIENKIQILISIKLCFPSSFSDRPALHFKAIHGRDHPGAHFDAQKAFLRSTAETVAYLTFDYMESHQFLSCEPTGGLLLVLDV
jgi:hypothetical protein